MKSREEYRAMFAKMKAKGPIKAYDLKKKMFVEMQKPELVFWKNGRGAIKGISSKSGIAVYKII